MATTENIKPKIKLYWLNDSRAQRIVWLLEELGLEYEVIPFRRDPQTMFAPPELGKVHPLGKAPAVGILYPSPLSEASSGSRDEKETVLVESGFITQYLCEHFSTDENRLVPKRYAPGNEGKAGGETEAWMRYQHLLHYAEGSLMPPLLLALILSIMQGPKIPFIVRPIVGTVAAKIYTIFVRPNVEKNFSFLQHLLETAPDGGPYLCGPHLTGADILMTFPLIAVKQRISELEGKKASSGLGLLERFPKVWEYLGRLEGHEGYKRALAKVEGVEEKVVKGKA